jgi:hypothetical protein
MPSRLSRAIYPGKALFFSRLYMKNLHPLYEKLRFAPFLTGDIVLE